MQLVYLLATAAEFDVWGKWRDCMTSGKEGNKWGGGYTWYVAYCTRLLDNSQIRQLVDCQLADWSTRILDNSCTGQVADWTTRGCHRRLSVLSFRSSGGICETASCSVRELTSEWVV